MTSDTPQDSLAQLQGPVANPTVFHDHQAQSAAAIVMH